MKQVPDWNILDTDKILTGSMALNKCVINVAPLQTAFSPSGRLPTE